MKKFYGFFNSRCLFALAVIMLACAHYASAQYLRSSYFMEGSQYRLQLNPALAPPKGFVHLPGIGHVNASVRSNSLTFEDVWDVIENKDDADYFLKDRFVNELKDENHALVNAGTDVLSVGWWQSKNSFWTINLSVKVDGSMNVNRGMFNFLRDMRGLESHDYSNYVCDLGAHEMDVNAYTEIGVGYSRRFGDRFNAGLRVKGLLGLGNANLKINKAVVKTNLQGVNPDINWTDIHYEDVAGASGNATIEVDAQLESSFEGFEYETNQDGYIDDMKFEAKHMGIAGVGAGVDLGVSARVIGGLSLSAALVDLGFIKWSKGATQVARTQANEMNFDTNNAGDILDFTEIVSSGETLNPDLLRLTLDEEAAKGRTTKLAPTLVLGADYAFNHDKVNFGVLFTNRKGSIFNETELTMSLNYNPSNFIGLTASYSPILSGGKSFGFALKLGPLFLGTDYMYLGKDTKCCNALFGLSIPLSARR